MSFITKYGSFWGLIPQTNGQVFWVAPGDGYTIEGRSFRASDDNDGLSPERAFRTLGRALDKVAADVNDVIVLLPGIHTLAAQETMDVAGVTLTGIPGGKGHKGRQRATLTTSAADETLLVGAARIELAHINFRSVTAQGAVEINNSADFLYIHDCSFDMYTAVASTSTDGITSIATAGGVTNLLIEDCYFESLDAQGNYLDLNDVTSANIERCRFRHRGTVALASAIISATGAVDVVFKDCVFTAGTGAIITAGFTWTGNTIDGSLQLIEVKLPVATTLVASADADIWVSEGTQVLSVASGASLPVNYFNAS